jgi:hypothetical protein
MNKKDIAQLVVAVIVILGAALGAIEYFAKADELELVDMRLEQKIVGDSISNLTRQMWQLEDKYGNKNCSTWSDPRDRERYRNLNLQLEQLKKKQDAIIRKQTKQ